MTTREQVVATRKTKINPGNKKFVIRPMNISYVNKWNHGSEQSSPAIGTKQKFEARKRGSPGTLEKPQNQKRRKMEHPTQRCSRILEKLMTHPAAWVFNQPVDPLMLNIPDYFSVVTHPMDLGTIKSKLVNNWYCVPGDFVADVRLTFTNAMLYNPAYNSVHLMAKELDGVFSKLWKSFDVKQSCESSSPEADHGQELNGRATEAIIEKKKKPDSMPKRSISFEDRQKLRKELSSVLRRNIPPHLCVTLRRFGLPLKVDVNFERTFDTLKDESFFELRKLVRNFVDTSAREVKSAKTVANRNGESLKNFRKGANSDIRHACLSESRRALGATITKAQHKTLLHHGDQADRAKMPKEKKRLEKKPCEEKTRIETEIRAAEQARTAVKLKTQREKEREAARVSLQMVEKTVEFDDNIQIMKELEMLCGFSPSDHESIAASGSKCSCTTFFSPCIGNPLERLGLILKSDYL